MLHYTADELMAYSTVRENMSGPGALDLDTGAGAGAGGQFARDTVVTLCEDRLVVRRRPTPDDLRPGPLWAGPSLLNYVDHVGYLLTVANLPHGSDAFTIDLYIKFLRPAPYDDLVSDTRLLRMSKRKADVDILLTSPAVAEGPVVHATATFSPRPASPPAS